MVVARLSDDRSTESRAATSATYPVFQDHTVCSFGSPWLLLLLPPRVRGAGCRSARRRKTGHIAFCWRTDRLARLSLSRPRGVGRTHHVSAHLYWVLERSRCAIDPRALPLSV